MPFGLPSNSVRAGTGTWLGKFFAKPHPDAFTAGVRQDGAWRFALSAVDPYQPYGIVSLRHGKQTLRLGAWSVTGRGPRPGNVVLSAFDADRHELVELSVPEGDVERFGLAP